MRIIPPRISWIAPLLLSLSAFPQAPAPNEPQLAFEVASIKPAGPLDPLAIAQGKVHVGMKVDGAICDIGSFSLRDLIRTAYEVEDYQIAGADALGNPLDAQRFNIQATLPEGATEKQVPQMLQALLAERFKLVVHHETKEQSVYALVVAKGGPKLKPSDPEPPAAPAPAEPAKGETVIGQGANQVHVSGDMRTGQGITVKGPGVGSMHVTMADGRMHMEAAKMSMATLADTATRFVGKPVVDMTDLKGDYQVVLELSLGDLMHVAQNAGVPLPGGTAAIGGQVSGQVSDPGGATIFESIQRMGLKLEARKAPLDFIVVDHFEKTPTEN